MAKMRVEVHEGDKPCTESGVCFIPELLQGCHMQHLPPSPHPQARQQTDSVGLGQGLGLCISG